MISLDVIAPILSPSLFLFGFFMLLCVLLEGFVIGRILKINKKLAVFQAFIANLATTIIGFWYIDFYANTLYAQRYMPMFISGYLLSALLELTILKTLNKKTELHILAKTSFAMNAVSYVLLIIIFVFFQV